MSDFAPVSSSLLSTVETFRQSVGQPSASPPDAASGPQIPVVKDTKITRRNLRESVQDHQDYPGLRHKASRRAMRRELPRY